MINQAIAKITEEMMQDQNDGAIVAIEEYLTSICTTEAIAKKLLAEGKTLKGAFGAMRKAAEQKKNGRNCVCLPPEEGFRIVENYYEITPEDKEAAKSYSRTRNSGVIDITDLL